MKRKLRQERFKLMGNMGGGLKISVTLRPSVVSHLEVFLSAGVNKITASASVRHGTEIRKIKTRCSDVKKKKRQILERTNQEEPKTRGGREQGTDQLFSAFRGVSGEKSRRQK